MLQLALGLSKDLLAQPQLAPAPESMAKSGKHASQLAPEVSKQIRSVTRSLRALCEAAGTPKPSLQPAELPCEIP